MLLFDMFHEMYQVGLVTGAGWGYMAGLLTAAWLHHRTGENE